MRQLPEGMAVAEPEAAVGRVRLARIVALVVVAVLVVTGYLVGESPNAYRGMPGPTFNIAEDNNLPDTLQPEAGSLLVLTVEAASLTRGQALWMEVTGDDSLLYADSPNPAGAEAARQASLRAAQQFTWGTDQVVTIDDSKIQELPAGSVVLAMNGTSPSTSPVEGEWFVITDGTFRTVHVSTVDGLTLTSAPGRYLDGQEPVAVGPDAVTSPAFVFPPVQGNSAGLIQALAWVDVLQGENLVGGRTVAATGAIDSNGQVSAVDSLPFKLAAASRDRADVVFVPANSPITEWPGTTVVPVASLDEAVEWLRTH